MFPKYEFALESSNLSRMRRTVRHSLRFPAYSTSCLRWYSMYPRSFEKWLRLRTDLRQLEPITDCDVTYSRRLVTRGSVSSSLCDLLILLVLTSNWSVILKSEPRNSQSSMYIEWHPPSPIRSHKQNLNKLGFNLFHFCSCLDIFIWEDNHILEGLILFILCSVLVFSLYYLPYFSTDFFCFYFH